MLFLLNAKKNCSPREPARILSSSSISPPSASLDLALAAATRFCAKALAFRGRSVASRSSFSRLSSRAVMRNSSPAGCSTKDLSLGIPRSRPSPFDSQNQTYHDQERRSSSCPSSSGKSSGEGDQTQPGSNPSASMSVTDPGLAALENLLLEEAAHCSRDSESDPRFAANAAAQKSRGLRQHG